jgi:glycerophosphoryl diester phosphodiesterase
LFEEQFEALTRHRPLILGHRGSPTVAPENSLASFQAALDCGADGIELDVQRTADGILIAHHDDLLPGGEPIGMHPYSALLSLAHARNGELPQLADVFRLVAGRGLLNIELKSAGYEQDALALARDLLPAGSFAFSSFDSRAVMLCRKAAPDVPAFLITFGPRNSETDLELLQGLDASGVAAECRFLTADLARTFRDHHYPLFCWTVNDPAEALRLASYGVHGLITDVPQQLLDAFNR